MFRGFTDRTFEFFMAIRMNNNREFYTENREWYEAEVREPMRALAAELSPAIAAIDGRLQTRPEKVISRINRDVRYSRDKSPYRDYSWMAFRRPGEDRNTTLGCFFDLSDVWSSYGMGYYSENRPVMNALRRQLRLDPDAFAEAMRPAMERFDLHPNEIKRMPLPEGIREDVAPWYRLRGFYVSKGIEDYALLRSRDLVGYLISGYEAIAPLYRYITSLTPEEDASE